MEAESANMNTDHDKVNTKETPDIQADQGTSEEVDYDMSKDAVNADDDLLEHDTERDEEGDENNQDEQSSSGTNAENTE